MTDGAVEVEDLRTLYAAHASPIHAFALRATADPQVAEEIVQDTFLRAWRAMDRFDPSRGEIGGWLFSIARNLVVDHFRRVAARPSTLVPGERLERHDSGESDIDQAVEVWLVADALAQLSNDHREAIMEVHLRGSTIAEAADRLGIPPGTVKSRVYYGMRAMRLVLEETGVVR